MTDIANLAVSSRVRLARNLENVPFHTREKGVFDGIAASLRNKNPNFVVAPVSALPADTAQALFEQHLISGEFLTNKTNGIIVTRNDNRVVIMLGEEDHIRVQSIQTGFDLQTAFADVKKIADDIASAHNVAWRGDFGFLTACPTNLGTGMRASVMMFLPALTMAGQMQKIAEQLSTKHLTVRGVYGESSTPTGYMYQVSNQSCIRMTEKQILDMVQSTAVQIGNLELRAEADMYRKTPDQIIDGVMRAWGLLTNAYMISSAEAVENLAMLKLGSNLGIMKFKNQRILDDLFFVIQPRTLATVDNRAGNVVARDKIRASRIAKELHASRV